ncbi:unnamed protein product [Rotaria magnacalcarata]|uniref:Tetraspanin n=4 Tax=Rotaria magnacalcarata TaxID=392030 RepID=A0A816HB35_9BILA|nr:unnamed protein product [Rotaria magnacalcarata]CAF3758537.1 unnamed protein product [Rotaria magnacalcarata]CAF3831425.1 unnamed protein product [Rotaria magnacalcarata]
MNFLGKGAREIIQELDKLFPMAPRFQKVVRKTRRHDTEISRCIKYLMFGFNILFWILGFMITAIGIYAWIEKDTFDNFGRLTMRGTLFFDPALVFVLVGIFMFCIGFAGCVGSLRENTCLLLFFSFALAIIFFAQLAFGTLVFIYREKVKNESEKQLMVMIESYRDDPDLQNMIDWIQRDWLHCCGVNNYRNWESNIYFNCSSKLVGSVEACGVPASCCRAEYFHNNKQCGYGTLESSAGTHMIYTDGCLPKASQWFERHILPVAIVIAVLAVLQILGICFAQNLRNDILAQKAKWIWQAHPMMNYYRHQ